MKEKATDKDADDNGHDDDHNNDNVDGRGNKKRRGR